MDTDLCTWIYNHLSEYLDAEMQTDVCEQLETHILECSSCRALLRTMKGTVEIVHELPERAISQRCLDRIKDQVLKGREPA